MAYRPYTFVIPTLPKDIYQLVKGLSEKYEITTWHVVILAIRTLADADIKATSYVQNQLEAVKRQEPWTPNENH